MKFYNGFALKGEEYLFSPYISSSAYTVCGFSYGAIKALGEVKNMLHKGQRVDRLQLFSPAFFQTKEQKFKRLQLKSYKANKELYLKNFTDSCFAPHKSKIISRGENTLEQLEELLEYVWSEDEFNYLESRGVSVEVYLGGADAIIDVKGAYEFFEKYSTLHYIKAANHFLLTA